MQIEIPAYITFVFPIIVAAVLLCIAKYMSDTGTDNEIEAELDRDKEESDRIRVTAKDLATGAIKSKELSERIGEHQQRASDSVGKIEKSIERAREKGRKTVELADECLAIIEEAEKNK